MVRYDLFAVRVVYEGELLGWDYWVAEVSTEERNLQMLVLQLGDIQIVIEVDLDPAGQVKVMVKVNGKVSRYTGSAEEALDFIESTLGELHAEAG